MKNLFTIYIVILTTLINIGCSDQSQIEGLVFSDEAVRVEVNKEITVVPNVASQMQTFTLNINDKNYSYSVSYTQQKQNNTLNGYLVTIQPITPLGMMKTNGNAAYNVREGEEIGNDSAYFGYGLPLLQISGNNSNNFAANTIKLNEPFYLGFSTDSTSEYATYGWLKINITNEKITISSYGYRAGKTIKAGE